MRKFFLALAMLFLAGCSASTQNIGSLVLPTSNKTIDVVQHRSDVKFADCGTLVVLQTYSATGDLIDSKDARGNALHCDVIVTSIEAGGMYGAARAIRPATTEINNAVESVSGAISNAPTTVHGAEANISVSNSQSQDQGQSQAQSQSSKNTNSNSNKNSNSNSNSNKNHTKEPKAPKEHDDNGHGNDPGHTDPSNPGHGHGNHGSK